MKIKTDVATKEFFLESESKRPKQLYIGFLDNGNQEVEFNNLSFGFDILLSNEVVVSYSLPEEGATYNFSDQEFLEGFDLYFLKFGKDYNLRFWANNAGDQWGIDIPFSIDFPYKTFSSWIWDEEIDAWIAPIPYPNDDNFYTWDEEMLNWKITKIDP